MPVFGLDLSDFGFLTLPFDMEILLCDWTEPQRPSREYGRRRLLVGFRWRRREHLLAALVRDGQGRDSDLVRRHRSEKVFGVLIVVLCPDRVSA